MFSGLVRKYESDRKSYRVPVDCCWIRGVGRGGGGGGGDGEGEGERMIAKRDAATSG